MNSNEIYNILKNCKHFRGVFPSDKLLHANKFKSRKKTPQLFIVNFDPAHMKGSHWIAIYIPPKYTREPLEYFDSYGLP